MNDLSLDLHTGIAVSTRIRLARNVQGYPFPSRLQDEVQAKELIRRVYLAFHGLSDFSLVYMDAISSEEAEHLVEQRLISTALARKKTGAVIVHGEQSVSVMINEEDHLREQSITKGADLAFAYQTIKEIDDVIGRVVPYSYDDELGYLTACPTNLGTGLRASVMLFLPALTMQGQMKDVQTEVERHGLIIRGAYGEGSKAEGYLYQISNEVTLGVTEDEIIRSVERAVQVLTEREVQARRHLLSSEEVTKIKDTCQRAWGILSHCALLSEEELLSLGAKLKLGVCLGFFTTDDVTAIDDLILDMRDSHLERVAHLQLKPQERDAYRAQAVCRAIAHLIYPI